MIAVQLSDDSISKTSRRQQIIDGLHEIPSMIRKVLAMDKNLQQLARDMLAKEKSLLIMGRGYQCEFPLIIPLMRADAHQKTRCDMLGRCIKDQGGLLYA